MAIPDPPVIWSMLYAFMIIFIFSEIIAASVQGKWTNWCLNVAFFVSISYDFYVVTFDKGLPLWVMLGEYVSLKLMG